MFARARLHNTRAALGAIAQLGERLLCKQEVVGSIPSGSTIFFANLQVTAEEFCEPSLTLGVA